MHNHFGSDTDIKLCCTHTGQSGHWLLHCKVTAAGTSLAGFMLQLLHLKVEDHKFRELELQSTCAACNRFMQTV